MTELEAFAHELVQDVLANAEAGETTAPDSFTQRLIDDLTEAGELDDGLVCYHRTHGIEVSGYSVPAAIDTLDLFITHFTQHPLVPRITKTTVETLLRRLYTFAARCRRGSYENEVEDASPVFDMVLDVGKASTSVSRIRLFLFTNSLSATRTLPPTELDGIEVSHHVWDVQRLHRLCTSGSMHEAVTVDFVERFGRPLPCLGTPVTDCDYSVLLTIMPGDVLDQLYGEYGTRLLELNVRSYLQAKGAVNRGIRETLLTNPDRFLAYNNGISAVASHVDLTEHPGGSQGIRRLHDLQIVNGGQTTASIHHAARRDKADVSRVLVQAKVTVISPSQLQDIVPAISKYSNTQNKVTTADFSSNDPYHVELEKLSRSTWAPSPVADGQETRWFYERARGQYADALAGERTPARQRAFKTINPTRQKFTKTDVAKFRNSWDQLPHIVSRGAEKNFREFMVRMDQHGRPAVDLSYYRRLIATAILFRSTERIVSRHGFGGYRANIVTYTLAKLANATSHRVDLDQIWRAQALSPALERAISQLCVLVQRSITNPPRQANIGEWCKRPECWARVVEISWPVPSELTDELLSLEVVSRIQKEAVTDRLSEEEKAMIAEAAAVPKDTWFAVSHWAKETHNLQPWQRGIAFSLGQLAARGGEPSIKQAVQGLRLLQEAERLGFRVAARQ